MNSRFSSPFMAKSPLNNDTKDPKVKRRDLDKKGKKIYDDLRKENRRLLKTGMTQKEIDAMRLKKHKEKEQK